MEDRKYIGITDNRLKHMRSVAEECYRLAKEHGLDEDDARAAYVMGFLHDIGYAFSEKASQHPEIGKQMINCAFAPLNGGIPGAGARTAKDADIADCICRHGHPYELDNIFTRILDDADMSVNSKGEKVSHEERLSDITVRYGADSRQARNASLLLKAFEMPDDKLGDEILLKEFLAGTGEHQ